jgi:hypothetical protein
MVSVFMFHNAELLVLSRVILHNSVLYMVIHPTCLTDLQGPFAKFMDSPYYSESELCGGAMMVSFSKYLLW